MRYDQPVTFVKLGEKRLPTGDYTRAKVNQFMCRAHISSVGLETQERPYGKVTQSALTLRLLREPTDPFDHMVIGGKKYSVTSTNRSRHKVTYIVSEVKE